MQWSLVKKRGSMSRFIPTSWLNLKSTLHLTALYISCGFLRRTTRRKRSHCWRGIMKYPTHSQHPGHTRSLSLLSVWSANKAPVWQLLYMVSIQGGRREERIRMGWAYRCMVWLGVFQHPPPGGRTLVHRNGDLPSIKFAGTRLYNRLSKRRCERINKIFNFSVVTFLFCFTFSFKFYTERSSKNIFIQEKLILRLPFNPGLALTALRTTQPWSTTE